MGPISIISIISGPQTIEIIEIIEMGPISIISINFFPLAWLESMSTGEAVWDLIERAVEFMDSWTQKKLTTILNGDQTRWTPHPCEEGSLVSPSVSQGNRFLAIKATKISHEAKHDTLTVPFSLYPIIKLVACQGQYSRVNRERPQ